MKVDEKTSNGNTDNDVSQISLADITGNGGIVVSTTGPESKLDDNVIKDSEQGTIPDSNKSTEPESTKETKPVSTPKLEAVTEEETEESSDYFLNEKGDIVDTAGKVIVTADKVQKDAEGNAILPDSLDTPKLIEGLSSGVKDKLGVELVDEKGTALVFEDTEEGILNFTIETAKRVVAQEQQKLFAQYPKVYDYLQHIIANGSDEAFFDNSKPSWKDTKLPEDTKIDDATNAIRKQVITDNYLERYGYYTADQSKKAGIMQAAKDYVTMIEDSGKLVSYAKPALTDLQEMESTREQERNTANAAQIKAQQDKSKQYWNNVGETIKQGDLKGIKVPESERDAFAKYVSVDVTGKGQTQEALDAANSELALNLQLAYMRFKKFNLEDLIKVKSTENKIDALRKRKIILRPHSTHRNDSGDGGVASSKVPKLSELLN